MPPLAAVRVAGQTYRQPAGQETRSSLRQPAGLDPLASDPDPDPPPAGQVFRLGSLDYRVKKRQPKTKNHQFFIMASGLTNVS